MVDPISRFTGKHRGGGGGGGEEASRALLLAGLAGGQAPQGSELDLGGGVAELRGGLEGALRLDVSPQHPQDLGTVRVQGRPPTAVRDRVDGARVILAARRRDRIISEDQMLSQGAPSRPPMMMMRGS
eukprot:SAG25_NODE_203_length_11965_cov_47.109641_1_plen_127_part_10